MSYTFDIYNKKISNTRSPLDFALFVSFFPQLVAGPIIRAKEFLPQLQTKKSLQINTKYLWTFLSGLFKKVIIADNLGGFVDHFYQDPERYSAVVLTIAAICFMVQIYCDFAGYSEMAIGIAGMLGYVLPENFKRPFFAINFRDYWRQWHISLSTWFKDYVYIPLGGSKKNKLITIRNILITFFISGLWHGAGWNFIVFGVLNGLFMIIPSFFRLSNFSGFQRNLISFISWILTQAAITITFVAFRITDFDKMASILNKFLSGDFLNLSGIGFSELKPLIFIILFLFMGLHTYSNYKGGIVNYLVKAPLWKISIFSLLLGMCLYFFWPMRETPFIYFQF